MRLPNAAHESRPWRIHEIAPDFTLEDVWVLPVHGGAGDFPALLAVMASHDLTREASPVTRLLFEVVGSSAGGSAGMMAPNGRSRGGPKRHWPNGCRMTYAERRPA